ncbi:hypothetical protein [uncultured Microbacterium sp.]|uniref:hypothetical protein n=1 Tax=uncultured Microbacterium sp. TaxID=191216 RepID=UPI0035CCA2A9
MSMSEPIMPPHKHRDDSRSGEHDIDTDVDVFLDDEGDSSAGGLPTLPANGVFRVPAPGEALTAEQLQSDLDKE